MSSAAPSILTVNAGSSSIKFSLYRAADQLIPVLHGAIENIGKPGAILQYTLADKETPASVQLDANDQHAASQSLIGWLQEQNAFTTIKAVGHRIVHGMEHTAPAIVTPDLIGALDSIVAYDPDHLPAAIQLMKIFQQQFPAVLQVACFDTAFHADMPQVAKQISLPRRFIDKGIRRYGFHGLSYAFLLQALEHEAGNDTAHGSIIIAHLGSGASLAAVKNGKSMDTSMGFTPASGIPMSTRAGDLDPGLAWYIMQQEHTNPEQFSSIVNHQSGLLGISGTSADMKELLQLQHTDDRAAEAVALFCYQVKKWIGSFAAVLQGVDTLIFSGGIGERAPEIRQRICEGLQFLGIELDQASNEGSQSVISAGHSRVCVRVIKTNEEIMIAQAVKHLLHQNT